MTHRIRSAAGPPALAAGLLLTGSAHAEPPANPADKPLPEITVEAQRAALEKRVNTYVTSLTRTTPRDEALRRWQVPICPLVAGLSQEKGEFILERLSQIARAVGAPLDKESCRANLAVIFTTEPDVLVKAWGARRNVFGGVRGTPAAFSRFRERRRPVRVWYNREFGTGRPAPVLPGSLQMGFTGVVTSGEFTGSRLLVHDVLVFTSVAVIVDGNKIAGVEIGPLADYIAVAAFTESDLDAPMGSAPTILRLFEPRNPGEQVPQGLTAWDRSFLEALYHTDLDFVGQRSAITARIMADIAPPRQ